jgi:hypothetical protein
LFLPEAPEDSPNALEGKETKLYIVTSYDAFCSVIAIDADGQVWYHAMGEWKEVNATGSQKVFRDHISYN